MLLHTIGRIDVPGGTNAWMAKYIFPGGYVPALSDMLPPIERAGLIVTDVEVLRLHYAETLRAWRERFMANRAAAEALYDDRFCRMWEYYLAACETAFRFGNLVVFQIQLTKELAALPITRDYILEAESRLQQKERRLQARSGLELPFGSAAASRASA
jgi:cyclopropane-fatty-acyl-phospholipid synthase